MPHLSVDVPDHLYARALRVIADLLEQGDVPGLSAEERVDEVEGPQPWVIERLLPGENVSGDINRLTGMYLRLTPNGQRLLDCVMDLGPLHEDDLLHHVGFKGPAGLAGAAGHITKTATAVGRVTPLIRDPETHVYKIREGLTEALFQARLYHQAPSRVDGNPDAPWAPDENGNDDFYPWHEPGYEHVFHYAGHAWQFFRERPVRFLILSEEGGGDIVVDGKVRPMEFASLDALEEFSHEILEESVAHLEFRPARPPLGEEPANFLIGTSSDHIPLFRWPSDEDGPFGGLRRPRMFPGSDTPAEWPPLRLGDSLDEAGRIKAPMGHQAIADPLPFHPDFDVIDLGPVDTEEE